MSALNDLMDKIRYIQGRESTAIIMSFSEDEAVARGRHEVATEIKKLAKAAIESSRKELEALRDGMVNAADIHARVGKEPLFRTPKERHSDLGAAGALYSHAAKLTAFLEGGGE